MSAYYNEINPFAAMWLRVLIQQGHIPAGDVDTRSIEDVRPDDLRHYTQCHFFAGIGVWALALRNAGWPDDREVWTGSCPCQPFSAAGKGAGFADERHLWPAWFHLIQQCRPREILGEQVAAKDGLAWLDLVQADLEAAHYTNAAIDLCAAGVGAPHLRQRLWFVANADGLRPSRECGSGQEGIAEHSQASKLAVTEGERQQGGGVQRHGEVNSENEVGAAAKSAGNGEPNDMGNTEGERRTEARAAGDGPEERPTDASTASKLADPSSKGRREDTRSSPSYEKENGWKQKNNYELTSDEQIYRDRSPSTTNGYWADADWLLCKDGKWRAVEPGTFPLADGAPARVGSLCGYGNAINAEAAKTFIASYMESKQMLLIGAQQ